MQALQSHPYAEFFPLMEEKELNNLADDIKQYGQQESIKLLDGQILDGRNRYQACLKAGIEPKFETVKIEKPLEYALSLNLHRRHLDESQRAIVAAKISNVQICTSEKAEKITQGEAAKIMNVSRRSVASAAKVQEKALPELCKAVESGEIPVSVAALACDLEPQKQKDFINMDKKERSETLKNKQDKSMPSRQDTCVVSISFSREEIRLIDHACRRLKGSKREKFMHEIIMNFCTEGMPPKKSEIQSHMLGKKEFIKKSYSDKQLTIGKNGMSKQDEDLQKEAEHFLANLPLSASKMSAEALDRELEKYLAR